MPNGFQIGPLQPSTAGLKPLSPEEQALLDRYNESQQALDPTWKKVIRGGTEGIAGAASSLFGQNFEPGAPSAFDKGNATGQLLQAGLPFLGYAGKLADTLKGGTALTEGIGEAPQVYHGTQRLFEKFNPTKNDTSDVLGWMTHFAEDPNYAGTYAGGQSKGLKKISFNPSYGAVEPGELIHESYPFRPSRSEITKVSPQVIAARPKAQNVLDLADPNPDDLSAALASLAPDKRKGMLNEFKAAKANVREDPEGATRLLKENHYGSVARADVPKNEIPVRYLADRLRMEPEEFDRTLFDAIRYRDNEHKAWAIPSHTPIETPWGTPLTETPKELKVFKHYQDTGSTAQPTTNFRTMSQERGKGFWDKYAKPGEANIPNEDPIMSFPNNGPNSIYANEKIKPFASHTADPTWAAKVVSENPHYTDKLIEDQYFNNVISAKEKNLLISALHNKGK